jgi:hypothetical protein
MPHQQSSSFQSKREAKTNTLPTNKHAYEMSFRFSNDLTTGQNKMTATNNSSRQYDNAGSYAQATPQPSSHNSPSNSHADGVDSAMRPPPPRRVAGNVSRKSGSAGGLLTLPRMIEATKSKRRGLGDTVDERDESMENKKVRLTEDNREYAVQDRTSPATEPSLHRTGPTHHRPAVNTKIFIEYKIYPLSNGGHGWTTWIHQTVLDSPIVPRDTPPGMGIEYESDSAGGFITKLSIGDG